MTPLLAGVALAFGPAPGRVVPNPDASYVIMDARTHTVIAAQWEDVDNAIPAGSLVKPFTALAYGGMFPELECKGFAGRCWRAQPHGKLAFADALAQSCNAYFLQLAAGVRGDALETTAATLGLPRPHAMNTGTLIGLGDQWRIPPLALMRAYVELAARRGDPRADPILTGLERAARTGTARELGRELPHIRLLAKTGTAPCVSKQGHAGDRFTLALYPSENPQVAVLVRVHNAAGIGCGENRREPAQGGSRRQMCWPRRWQRRLRSGCLDCSIRRSSMYARWRDTHWWWKRTANPRMLREAKRFISIPACELPGGRDR